MTNEIRGIRKILIRELVDTICEYLTIEDIVNFHDTYSYPLSVVWLRKLKLSHQAHIDDMNACLTIEQVDNKSKGYQINVLNNEKSELKNVIVAVTSNGNKVQKERDEYRGKIKELKGSIKEIREKLNGISVEISVEIDKNIKEKKSWYQGCDGKEGCSGKIKEDKKPHIQLHKFSRCKNCKQRHCPEDNCRYDD
jgi:vacuolar-type H+-ATPase subunit I/STV1